MNLGARQEAVRIAKDWLARKPFAGRQRQPGLPPRGQKPADQMHGGLALDRLVVDH